MSRRAGFVIGGIVLLAFVCYAASPYYSFWRFREALRNADGAAIGAHVDFPALRDSMKRELHERLFPQAAADKSKKKNRWEAMLQNAAPTLIDTLVDAYITPDGIVALLADPRIAVTEKQPPNPSDAAPAAHHNFDWSKVGRATFTGLRDFAVDANGTKLRFRFSLAGWRLRAIDLPADVHR